MATAPAVQRSRMMWQVRGTWSAREDRLPSAVWLGILWVGMIAGFGADIPAFAHKNPPVPKVYGAEQPKTTKGNDHAIHKSMNRKKSVIVKGDQL